MFNEIELLSVITDIAAGPFGSNLKVSCFVPYGFPIIDGANLKGFKVTDNLTKFVTEDKARSLGRSIARRGDVVVTISGTLGQIAYIPNDSMYEEYLCSQRQFRVSFDTSRVYVPYLVFYFHTNEGQNKILAFANQTGVPALSQPLKNFKKIRIHLPSYDEQRRIASVIESINNKIECNQKINDNLEATAQAIFQEQFAPYYEADELPNGYSIVTLDSLCTVKGGKRLPADCELLDTPTEHPYIRVRDVGSSRYVCLTDQFQYIDEETHSAISRYIVNTDDIIISIVGTIGLLGKVHSSLNKANLTENCVKLAGIHTVTSDYLYYTLCYKKQIKEIELLTVGAVQAKLPMYNIQSMKILVPLADVIEDFQCKMNVFNKQIEANTVEIQSLYELQGVLLAKLSD